MIKKIKKFIFAVRVAKELEEEIKKLKVYISETEELVGEPMMVIRKVLDRGINFYDTNQIESEEHRRVYQKSVDDILRNEAFNNEVNAIIADCVEFCAKESSDHDKTLDARMTINGLELLKSRFKDINLVSDKKEKKEDRLDVLYNKHYN